MFIIIHELLSIDHPHLLSNNLMMSLPKIGETNMRKRKRSQKRGKVFIFPSTILDASNHVIFHDWNNSLTGKA